MRSYYVYILSSRSRNLYIGVTDDLERRVWQHRTGAVPGFTSRYRINRLVYYEDTTSAESAITREKQLKGWRRNRKVELIESVNPTWQDLAEDWFDK